MDLLLLVYESLCFVVFVSDGRGSLFCTSYYVTSPSLIVIDSISSSFYVALLSVWGQLICMLLVSCLMGYGPSALNTFHVAVIDPIPFFFMSKLFILGFSHISDSV